jgi:hypothetical protein
MKLFFSPFIANLSKKQRERERERERERDRGDVKVESAI